MRDSDRKGGSEGLAIPFELPQKWYRLFVITPAKSNTTVVGKKHEGQVYEACYCPNSVIKEGRNCRGKA